MHTAQAAVMNLSPQNNSVTAQRAGAVNATVFECDSFHQDINGEFSQISTTWMLQKFWSTSGSEGILVIQSAFMGVFLIGGTPRPPGFDFLGKTYRNRIKVLNFTEDLDGAVLACGSEEQGSGYFNLRVYSKLFVSQVSIKVYF